uniref:Uncharacterized protein n=1 Tax=Daphnia galeata TaxID=27404 RepID=A0A8J2RYB6_9CRUS|nr:unnamed protein product [Daphnia galeata]
MFHGASSAEQEFSVVKLSVSTVFHVNNHVDDEDYLKRGAEEIIAEFVTATVVTETESPPRNEKRKVTEIESDFSESDTELTDKYKKLKADHEMTKLELRESKNFAQNVIQDLPNLIRNAVRDALTKDFLVIALKEAFPEGLAVENPRNPVDRPLPENNTIANAKTALLAHIDEENLDLMLRDVLDASKITKNLVAGLFSEQEMVSTRFPLTTPHALITTTL